MIDGKAFYKLSYGLYVVSSSLEGKYNGQIANTIFQVTSDPSMIAVSINKQNLTHEYIEKSGLIGISVLSIDTPMDFIGKFGFKSGRDINKFLDTNYKIGTTGVPLILDNAASCFELKVEKQLDVFTHTIFVGRVESAEALKDVEQMTYDYYQKVKRGKSPKSAPTYIVNREEFSNDKKLNKYECSICGYVYDPSVGDPDGKIPAGMAFEDLPDNWVCPICGASKDQFKIIS